MRSRPVSSECSALLTFSFCGGDGWINQEIGGDREPSEFLAAGRQSGKKSLAGRTTGKLDACLPVCGRVEGVGTQVGRVMSSALAGAGPFLTAPPSVLPLSRVVTPGERKYQLRPVPKAAFSFLEG